MKFKVHLNAQLSNKFRREMILCNKFIKYEDSLFWFLRDLFFLIHKGNFSQLFVLFIELQVPLYNWYIKDYRNGNHVLIEVIFNSCHGMQAWLWYGNENSIGIELDFWVRGREVCGFFSMTWFFETICVI